MDDSAEKTKDLVQLSRLALTGRAQDIQTYVLRMSRKYRKSAPELAGQLQDLIKHVPTRQSPLRNQSVAAIPVDRDSRLQLLRLEPPGELEHEPIWSPKIARMLEQIVAEHQRTAELLDAGLSPTRTAIFTGPPGVGKTLAAKWIASRLERPLLTLDLSAVMSSFLGRTGSNVRHVLDYAKGVPCVMLLDELDAVAKRRDDAHEVGELKRLVTVLLQEIDDWPEGGLLVAATNHQELLDPAVWRRFETHVEFELPGHEAVEQAIKTFLGDSADLSETWCRTIVELLEGQSFSDIRRELLNVRRQAILQHAEMEEVFPLLIRRYVDDQPKSVIKDIARRLTQVGLSQRSINDLTGLSRDTIRKLNSKQEAEN